MKQAQPEDVTEVIKRFGGPSMVAHMLGLHHATVTYWQEIPLRYVADLARAVGVKPSAIRPELAELFKLEKKPTKPSWVHRARQKAA